MPNITMEDFIDECLTGKKPRRKRKIKESKSDVSSIFEQEQDKEQDKEGDKNQNIEKDDSIVDTSDAKDKEKKGDEEDKKEKIEKTRQGEKVLSLILNINDEKKIKRYTKKTFNDDIPLSFQSILKQFGLDLDQLSKKAEGTDTGLETDVPPKELGKETPKKEKQEYNKFKLKIKEYITSGSGNESIELSWRRDGEGDTAIETAEVITSNGSIPFNDSPDPLQAAVTTFDRIYYNDIISKIREKLNSEDEDE